MKKTVTTLLTFALLLTLVFAFTACGKSDVTTVEITTQPTKVIYAPGEKFDPTGMIVKATKTDGTKEIVTDYTVDKTEALTVADTKVIVSYGGYAAVVHITVSATVTDAKVEVDQALVSAGNLTLETVRYKAVYADGTEDAEWQHPTQEDLISTSYANHKLTLELELFVKNKLIRKSVEMDVTGQFLSVSELKTKAVGGVYVLEGTVVAIGQANVAEFVILDETTGDMIGVSGLSTGGAIKSNDLTSNYKVGDRVAIPVKLVKKAETAGTSDSKKLYCEFSTEGVISGMVLSSGNQYNLPKDKATVISNQEELRSFLTMPERENSFYKLVKLHGKVNYITFASGTSLFYRFFFDGVTNYADQKIDGKNTSPVFFSNATFATTGKTFGEIVFGDANYRSSNWENPVYTQKDIYALFIGGNNYYHQFVLLMEDSVSDGELVSVEPKHASISLQKGATFQPENYDLLLTYSLGTSKYIPITADMLEAATLPDMQTPGTYTVRGSYLSKTFSFTVEVSDLTPTSIALLGTPSKNTFHMRDWQNEVKTVLQAMQLTVQYPASSDTVAITEDMISFDTADTIGSHVVTITFRGATTTLDVTVENQALSIAQLKAVTDDEFHDLQAVVVNPISSFGAAELLLKDKNSNDLIGVYNTGIVGKYDALALDTTVLNVGDEIMVQVKKRTLSSEPFEGKVYANAVSAAEFKASLVILSHDNVTAIDPTTVGATEISTQDGLVSFLNSADRFYKVVKLTGAKGVNHNDGNYRIFFGNGIADDASQKVNGSSPYLAKANAAVFQINPLTNYFNNADSASYAEPATANADIYALYVGGNKYYHIFVPLADAWFVSTAA